MLEPKIVFLDLIKCKVYTNEDYDEFQKGIRARNQNNSSEDLNSQDSEEAIQKLNSTTEIGDYVTNL